MCRENLWKALIVEKSRGKGYPFAQADLAKIRKREGADQDSQKAEILFQQAVKTKDERIPFFLYLVFDQGADAERQKRAAQWLKIAEEKGEPCALEALLRLWKKKMMKLPQIIPNDVTGWRKPQKSGDYRVKHFWKESKTKKRKRQKRNSFVDLRLVEKCRLQNTDRGIKWQRNPAFLWLDSFEFRKFSENEQYSFYAFEPLQSVFGESGLKQNSLSIRSWYFL